MPGGGAAGQKDRETDTPKRGAVKRIEKENGSPVTTAKRTSRRSARGKIKKKEEERMITARGAGRSSDLCVYIYIYFRLVSGDSERELENCVLRWFFLSFVLLKDRISPSRENK